MVLTDEQVIQRLRSALEHETAGIDPPPGLLGSIHDELRSTAAPGGRRVRAPFPRLRLADLALLAALVVVGAVVAVFLGVQAHKSVGPAARGGGFTLVFRAEPTSQAPIVNRAVLARAVLLMRERTKLLGVSQTEISAYGKDQIVVRLPKVSNVKRAEYLVGTTARLEFYDWEANVLTPSGKFVATGLQTGDPAALTISQGGGSATGPGGSGGGSLSLYRAVKLAAKQPPYISKTNARVGPEYFLFGKSGSAACRAAAHADHATPLLGAPCYLAGPANTASALTSQLTPGVSAAQAARANPQTIKVNQGWVVMEAAPTTYGNSPPLADPAAQFYVVRDNVALFGSDITNPQQSTDAIGSPDVTFRFTPKGRTEFQNLTAQVAKRGSLASGLGQVLNQHFAVALDTQLVTVPFIDYRADPFGIPGNTGADIQGGFTIGSARGLAAQLRLQALPVNLKLISIQGRGG